MATASAGLGQATLYLDVQEVSVNGPANTSTFSWRFHMVCTNGSSYELSPIGWSVNIAGLVYSGTYTFDFRGTSDVTIASGTTTIAHGANGSLSFAASGTTNSTGTSAIGGPGTVSGTFYGSNIAPQVPTSVHISAQTATSITLSYAGPSSGSTPSTFIDQIANNPSFTNFTQLQGSSPAVFTGLAPGTNYWLRTLSQNASGNSAWVTVASNTLVGVPGAPTGLTPSAVTPSGMHLVWTAPTNVGGPNGGLTNWQVDYSLDSSFASGVTTLTGGGAWGTSTDLSGLLPGNTYYLRVRAASAGGWGAYSSTLSQTTLPSTPPSVTATPSVNGKSIVFTSTPPGGVTGVDAYLINLTDTVTGVTTAINAGNTSTYTQTGLVPGRTYSYTEAAKIGAYTSPYSTVQTVTTPNPSTTPGSYWDGAKAATPDTTYSWASTADGSVSVATGKTVTGWQATPVSTGSAMLARTSGGVSGSFGGTATVISDLANAAPSLRVGMKAANPYWSAVQASTVYNGSLYVDTLRTLSLAAELSWYTSSGTLISRVAGGATVVHSTDGWVRLNVTATSPANAAYATVAVIDAAGTSWSQLLGGDQIVVDAAMIILNGLQAYFDGDTPDVPTALYDWLGTADASSSSMTPLIPLSVDPLADPSLPSVPSSPQPPQLQDESIIAVGTWRRYWVVLPQSEVSAFFADVPTLTLSVGSVAADQIRVRYYANPEGLTPDVFDSSVWDAEQIVSYLPANTQLLIDGVSERAWASVNGAPTIAADKLLFGTGGVPATWPVLSCGVGYLISFDTPLSSPSNNLSIDVAMTRRM